MWVIVSFPKQSHNFFQTFRTSGMFKIVLRDSSLYPKQLSLFCLLWLISVSADRIDSITKFCLWHDITVGPAQKNSRY